MKQNDEYDWVRYTIEYEQQLRTMMSEGTEFFITDFSVLPDSLVYMNNLHPNWKEIYDTVYKLRPASILECGCGAGYHLKNIDTLLPNTDISGSDIAQAQLDLANRFSNLPVHISRQLSVHDFTKSPYPGRKFDFVFCHAVIMHLSTENAKAFLRNMAESSNKYIFLIEGVANHADWFGLVRSTLPEYKFERPAKHIGNAILLVKEGVEVKVTEPKKISEVHKFANGKIFAFDTAGQQMPEFTGAYNEEMKAAISRIMTGEEKFTGFSEDELPQKEILMVQEAPPVTNLAPVVRIKAVYLFPNNEIICFDYDDQQIPSLKGTYGEIIDDVRKAADKETEWNGKFPEPSSPNPSDAKPIMEIIKDVVGNMEPPVTITEDAKQISELIEKGAPDSEVKERVEKSVTEMNDLSAPPNQKSISYHVENEGSDGSKTFRDIKTNKWYSEAELKQFFSDHEIDLIKHRTIN